MGKTVHVQETDCENMVSSIALAQVHVLRAPADLQMTLWVPKDAQRVRLYTN